MESEPRPSAEAQEWKTKLPTDYRPSPERLHDLPPSAFNLEFLEPDQVASLVLALDIASSRNGRSPEIDIAEHDEQNMTLFTGLMQRDLTCLPARDLVKARGVYAALATHSESGVRALVSDVMDSLLQFELDDYTARQPVIDLWVALLQDADPNVREGVHWSISRAVHSDWLDEPTARYLDSKLPEGWQREDWW